MLAIQQYLRQHGEMESFRYFKDELALTIRETPDGRVLFKYSQIDSPLANPICQEARGLILDRRDWSVVSWPFRKFFNHQEGHAAPIDLATARVLEKIDGTCITLYWWRDHWRIQTLGMPDAEGTVYGTSWTFADLFRRTLGVDLAVVLDPSRTYTFELATLDNRIVTRYEQDRIVLLSVRERATLQEESIEYHIKKIRETAPKIELPATYPLQISSLQDVQRLAEALPALAEGYVVVDAHFNRVKVKNPAYLAIASLKDSTVSSVRALAQIALKNEGDEFLSYFPEYRPQFDAIRARLDDLAKRLHAVYAVTKDLASQKDFALAITRSGVPFVWILFFLRRGQIHSIEEGIARIDPKDAVEMLKLDDFVLVG